MAALTAATARRYRLRGKPEMQNFRVLNAHTIYVGSFVCMPGTAGLTSARGYARTYSNTQTVEWLGLAIGSPFDLSTTNTIVGDTSATPIIEVTCETSAFVLEQYAVTGVSAQTDVGKAFYASNDNDLTLTSSQSPAVGRIDYWWSSTTCDVLFYGRTAAIVI